ncbi:hypothetical protein [Pantoea stewartii]|uniref:hypothetical protein n=1 Tax=Pantoea stewartii TaxID=66269 RepID=UPI0025A19AC5|nr:hypothetical protein [Pantoea stewartii]
MHQLTASEASNDEMERQRYRMRNELAWRKFLTPEKSALEKWWGAERSDSAWKSKRGEA